MVRHVTAGPRALGELSALLGLTGWILDGACVFGAENVRFSLVSRGHRLVFYALPRSFALKPGAGPAAKKLLAMIAKKLGARGFAEFVAVIEADPLSFAERVDPERRGDRVQVPCIGQPLDLLETGWRNFYADQDFEVLLGVPTCSGERTVNIQYADLECYYARPQRNFRKWTFLDWPEESWDMSAAAGPEGGDDAGTIVTELEERDMVMGTGERADALVEEVRARAKTGDYLLFTHLCTPIIMGEDFSGLARRCEKEIGGASIRWSQKDRDENDNFGDHFRALLGAPGFFDMSDDSGAVNLFHFPKRVRDEELGPFLRTLGLEVNISVFPDVNFPALARLPKARWQVFCERSSYPTKVRALLDASPRPVVPVRAPYGLEGTRECLKAVAAAAGKEALFEKAWAARTAGLMTAWDEMKKEASGHRLAFVVSEATLPRLVQLRYGQGAPLAAMVREMGFGLDLVYYDRHGEAPVLPPGLSDARVSVFRAPWELERALREGEFSAAYSDIFFDWRISRAGKARFSGKDFEMGVEGARRTFERLLTVCRLPFYRRYAEHLKRGAHDR